jgi:hypothetical protein
MRLVILSAFAILLSLKGFAQAAPNLDSINKYRDLMMKATTDEERAKYTAKLREIASGRPLTAVTVPAGSPAHVKDSLMNERNRKVTELNARKAKMDATADPMKKNEERKALMKEAEENNQKGK